MGRGASGGAASTGVPNASAGGTLSDSGAAIGAGVGSSITVSNPFGVGVVTTTGPGDTFSSLLLYTLLACDSDALAPHRELRLTLEALPSSSSPSSLAMDLERLRDDRRRLRRAARCRLRSNAVTIMKAINAASSSTVTATSAGV